MVDASSKYYILALVSGIVATLTWISGQTTICVTTVITGITVGLTAAYHDLEPSSPNVSPKA
jgi:hypothetical protein